jgi:hypothetical protein
MKQTAVEWLFNQIKKDIIGIEYDYADEFNQLFDQAKEMEKEQIERMYNEEDLIDFAHFYFKEEFNSSMQTSKSTKDIFTEWFEQFKKK